VFNVGFAGVFSGFNDQHFHRRPPHQKFLSAHFSPTIYLWVAPRHPAVLLSNLLPKL
jgi:hypothetical protein